MTSTLTGDVGRTGRMEDVAMVQALLANTEGPDGRPFWDRRIDGRPGAELAAAIEGFQRRSLGTGVAVSASELGVVRPASQTWRMLYARFASSLGELRAVAGNPVLLYASRDPGAVASDTAAGLRRGETAQARIIGHRLRLELAAAIEEVATVTGVGLALDRAALAHDRVAMWFRPVGLSALGDYGRPQSMEGQPGGLPTALWQAVDREMSGRAAVESIGRGGYRPRDALQGLLGEQDGTLLARFEIDPGSIRGERRPVLAALALIERIDRLSPAAHDELQQLFDIVAVDDPGVAEVLRQKRDMASRGANRQPEAVGDGPSPFEQAVDLMLRITARNYQSSHMAQLRALTRDARDRLEAGLRFKDLVANRGAWDVKREFPRWARDHLEGVEYGSDLWGNLHYGYIGGAAGFTATELELGGHYQAFMETEAYWDDAKDQNAIELGYMLWKGHRFPLPRGSVIDALRARKAELNTR